jgi:hypothetical protein
MTRSILFPLGLSGALLLAPAAMSQTTANQKTAAMCVPPGGNGFAACPPARPGQAIRLQVATTNLPIDAINLVFVEDAPAGRAPRTANAVIPPSRSRDGSYEVTVPAALCATGRGTTGNFEVQRIFGASDDAAGTPQSLGTLTVTC